LTGRLGALFLLVPVWRSLSGDDKNPCENSNLMETQRFTSSPHYGFVA